MDRRVFPLYNHPTAAGPLPQRAHPPTSTGFWSLADRDFWERVPRNTCPKPPLPSLLPVVYTGELDTWTCSSSRGHPQQWCQSRSGDGRSDRRGISVEGGRRVEPWRRQSLPPVCPHENWPRCLGKVGRTPAMKLQRSSAEQNPGGRRQAAGGGRLLRAEGNNHSR